MIFFLRKILIFHLIFYFISNSSHLIFIKINIDYINSCKFTSKILRRTFQEYFSFNLLSSINLIGHKNIWLFQISWSKHRIQNFSPLIFLKSLLMIYPWVSCTYSFHSLFHLLTTYTNNDQYNVDRTTLEISHAILGISQAFHEHLSISLNSFLDCIIG